MFALTSNMRYHLYQHDVDMRKGINGLYQIIRSEMPVSSVSGDVFVFFGKNRGVVKLLKWDVDGFVLYQKRLEKGTFEVPQFNPGTGNYELSYTLFLLIMQGISTQSVTYRKRFNMT